MTVLAQHTEYRDFLGIFRGKKISWRGGHYYKKVLSLTYMYIAMCCMCKNECHCSNVPLVKGVHVGGEGEYLERGGFSSSPCLEELLTTCTTTNLLCDHHI